MAQQCRVCEHPEREAVDAALGAGEPGREVARRFGLTEAGVRRHKANHPRGGEGAAAANPYREATEVLEAARGELAALEREADGLQERLVEAAIAGDEEAFLGLQMREAALPSLTHRARAASASAELEWVRVARSWMDREAEEARAAEALARREHQDAVRAERAVVDGASRLGTPPEEVEAVREGRRRAQGALERAVDAAREADARRMDLPAREARVEAEALRLRREGPVGA